VGNFAEFLTTARSGVALEGMHGSTDAANEFLVGGTCFELQASIVDGLQQFRGALEEERAKFRSPILGQKGQAVTSSRL